MNQPYIPEYSDGMEWQQRLTKIFGVPLGQPLLTLEEVLEKIEVLQMQVKSK